MDYEKLLKALGKFITLASKHLLTTVVVIFLFIIGYWAWVIGSVVHEKFDDILDFIEKYSEKNPSIHEEHERFNADIDVIDSIKSELQNKLPIIKADRLAVSQFHNGTTDLSSVPFNSSKITYMVTAKGIGFDERHLNSVPMSTMSDFIVEMWADRKHPVCVKRTVDQLQDPIMRQRVESRGTDSIYMCPIISLAGTPIGLLTASFMHDDLPRPADKDIFRIMEESANGISGYLLSINPKVKSNVPRAN